MRADRLLAALLLLQAKGKVTAAEIATELEVSLATARRDLEALCTAGIPVYAERGRQGGWRLLGGARTDLSGLSAPEARSLFLLLGPAAATSPQVASALRKLLHALPQTFRARAEAAADAIMVDPARWGYEPEPGPPLWPELTAAVIERQELLLDYRSRTGPRADRRVQPWGLIDKAGRWYLLAGTDAGPRTFRLDRIQAAVPTGAEFELPSDLDLPGLWSESMAQVHRPRSAVAAQVRLPAELRDSFAAVLGHAHVQAVEAEGCHGQLQVTSASIEMLARQLAGWVPEVEVLGPPEVRAELARIGRRLTARYGDSDG